MTTTSRQKYALELPTETTILVKLNYLNVEISKDRAWIKQNLCNSSAHVLFWDWSDKLAVTKEIEILWNAYKLSEWYTVYKSFYCDWVTKILRNNYRNNNAEFCRHYFIVQDTPYALFSPKMSLAVTNSFRIRKKRKIRKCNFWPNVWQGTMLEPIRVVSAPPSFLFTCWAKNIICG